MKGRALPSGVFVEVRRASWLDVIVARRATTGCPDLYSAYLLSRLATFDGEELGPDQIVEMDYADILAALEMVNELMAGPIRAKDLVQQMLTVVLGRAKTTKEEDPT